MPARAELEAVHVLEHDNRTRDDCERAAEKARDLLHQVLPDDSWRQFADKGIVQVTGKRGHYLISPCSQTEIRDRITGRCLAYSCLQLSIAAPHYDRMVAEYLLITNAEEVYWKTANIFTRNSYEFDLATLCLVAFDFTLFLNLVMNIWSLRGILN